jgi:hypothetical protein
MVDAGKAIARQTPPPLCPSPWLKGAIMTPCELSVGWLIATFIVGMSFGACVGTVVAALCRAAAIGDRGEP